MHSEPSSYYIYKQAVSFISAEQPFAFVQAEGITSELSFGAEGRIVTVSFLGVFDLISMGSTLSALISGGIDLLSFAGKHDAGHRA